LYDPSNIPVVLLQYIKNTKYKVPTFTRT